MDPVTRVGRETPAWCSGAWRDGERVRPSREDCTRRSRDLVDVNGVRADSVLRRAGWSADRKTFPEAATRVLMAEEVIACRAGLRGADRRGRAAFIG